MGKVVFVSSALQQPRHQKRIAAILSEFECDVVYFERDKYKINYNGFDVGATSVGRVGDGKYFYRMLSLLRLFFFLVKNKGKLVYCTSIDQAFVSILAGKKVILELGDLLHIGSSNPAYRWLDIWVSKNIRGLVLTSPFFWSRYFEGLNTISESDRLIIENKLPETMRDEVCSSRSKDDVVLEEGMVRVGVIGSLAFREPLRELANIALERSDVEVHVFGDGALDVFEGKRNCFVYGPFRNPYDLKSIYEKIDINFIVYNADNDNVKIALPNKLYESIAFCKPMICASNVALSYIVAEKGIGVICELSDLGSAIDEVIVNYSTYVKNMRALDEPEYLDLTKASLLEFVRERI